MEAMRGRARRAGRRAGAVLALGAALAAAAVAWPAGPGARAGAAEDCAAGLERARLWIRATDPQAPEAERARVRGAVEETAALCRAALAAAPDDPETMVRAAYAAIADGDRPGGVELVRRAAEAGHPPAMVAMARYLGRGDTVEKDVEGAWMLLIQALKSDDATARVQAALEFLPGGAGPENPKRTEKTLRELIAAGEAGAMVAYAMEVLDLRNAQAGAPAAAEGIALLERAAREAGHGEATIYLALLYNQGNAVARDTAKAAEWARMAIDAGIVRAYGTMGQIHQNQGEHEQAAEWFRKGAEAGDGFSQGMLGYLLSAGFGVERDMDEAVRWWTRGRWNGDRLSAGYLQVHREREAAREAWEAEEAAKKAEEDAAAAAAGAAGDKPAEDKAD